jgi:hypothetical protein
MSEVPLAIPDGSSTSQTRVDSPTSASSWKHLISPAGTLGVSILLIGLLAWPMLFTYSTFAGDWDTHLWLIWHQSLSIQANHHPTYFLNDSGGVFYPFFAFYGGTLYALVGLLSLLLGNAPLHTYILTYLLDFAAAYGGWYWIGRTAGLGRWLSLAPGLLFITSPYYLTLVYGRGDWPEFTAVSSIPLLIAAGLSVLRADRLRPLPALTLLTSSLIFFGSHNITALWGSTIITLTALAIIAFVPSAREQITIRGVTRVGSIAIVGLLLNAWYLLPDIAYEAHTFVSYEYVFIRFVVRETAELVSARSLFAPTEYLTGKTQFSLPLFLIAWALVFSVILLWTDRDKTWMRILSILVLIAGGLTVLMTHAGIALALPRIYVMLQFTYRLESYVLLSLSGIALAILVIAKRNEKLMKVCTGALIPVLAVSLFGALRHIDARPHQHQHNFATYLSSTLPLTDYIDVSHGIVDASTIHRRINFPTTGVKNERSSVTLPLKPGEIVETNLMGDADFVQARGATMLGVSAKFDTVLEVDPEAANVSRAAGALSKRTISLRPADTLPVVLGRILTLCALIAVFALLGVLLIGRRRPATAT